MRKRLDSEAHKELRKARKFQRQEIQEQRRKLVKVLSENKESKENKSEDLLIDLFEILERSGYGEHSPMNMENHSGDFISIAFGYQTAETAKYNYNNLVNFLKDLKNFEIKKEDENSIEFESGYFRSIKIYYKEGSESLIMNGYFNEKQIEKGKDKCRRFSRSREKYEQEEEERENIYLEDLQKIQAKDY